MDTTQKIVMFDASLQRECDHTIDIDGNGEIVLTSVESGSFVKLPADTDAAGLASFVAAYKSANEGQVSIASLEQKKAALLAGLQQDAPADVTQS